MATKLKTLQRSLAADVEEFNLSARQVGEPPVEADLLLKATDLSALEIMRRNGLHERTAAWSSLSMREVSQPEPPHRSSFFLACV